MKTKGVTTVIDIGNTKVCCCIANTSDSGLEIIGVGYCACVGMKLGLITDMESVEKSLAVAVENAERMANVRISSAYISISGKNVVSRLVNMSMKVGRIITERDMIRLFSDIEPESENVIILHSIPVWYQIDSLCGVKDPVGMYANKLNVCMNIVSVPRVQLQNLLLCLAKCHLELDGVIAATYAAGIGVMDEEDMKENQTVIDFGGGLTSISFFYKGTFCGSEVIPLGAQHITNDIAYGLNTSTINAERIKTLHGSALPSISDARDMIFAPVIEENERINLQQIPKSTLNRLIQARVDEILRIIGQKIEKSRFKSDFSRNIIITGGGSLLTGIREATNDVLKRPVIFKKIKMILPATDVQINHNFTVILGMIKLTQNLDRLNNGKNISIKEDGILKKTLDWVKKIL